MQQNEAAAHALVVALKVAGIDARVIGAGVHWKVEVASTRSRTLLIHCFWYERALSGLLLGMNPANSRSRLKSAQVPREGPEYLVVVKNDGTRVAEGRSCIVSSVVACARAWLASADLDALAHAAPFVDRNGRLMRALAHRLDPQLRWDIGDDPGYELWVYGNARSCKIESGDGTFACSFFIGQAQVARAAALEDVPTAVAAWLLPGISVRELPLNVPGVEIERHADVLEVDPARWHWLHIRDRMRDSGDVLAPLRELIAVLGESAVAKRFYCYSSLNQLCFSASSHYPWVNQDLPVVRPVGEGACVVDTTRCDIGRAVKLIERTLAAYAIRPFFGSAPHHELLLLSEQLSRQGSALRAEVVQRGAWFHLVVADGARRCDLADRHVTFSEGTPRRGVAYESLEDAVRGIRRYLEDDASLDELGPEPTTILEEARKLMPGVALKGARITAPPLQKPRPEGQTEERAAPLHCSFCGKSNAEVHKLIAGRSAFICDECVRLCAGVVDYPAAQVLVRVPDGGVHVVEPTTPWRPFVLNGEKLEWCAGRSPVPGSIPLLLLAVRRRGTLGHGVGAAFSADRKPTREHAKEIASMYLFNRE